ncbi:hypothetical protein L2E82_30478 [Cichorium intybus]|uniref:Uncharacterized protein n=1 Tax=Cichorium intybus TaxID=13427 RepID=A0ACB9D0R0_CICIN|nr:hypothetical protein L2E82_30478 [Cichorium intybus]
MTSAIDTTTQTITETATVHTSNLTPPPLASTPLTEERTVHKEAEVIKKSDHGPKKHLSFECKDDDPEEGKKKDTNMKTKSCLEI